MNHSRRRTTTPGRSGTVRASAWLRAQGGLSILLVLALGVACDRHGQRLTAGDAGHSHAPRVEAGPARQDQLLFGDRVPVTGTIEAGVSATVDVVRDEFGMVHIFASSLEDAFFAQGYMMAVDRHGQMELFRRAASGRLAEVFGQVSLEADITARTFGHLRAARVAYAAMPDGPAKHRLDAFARGVSAWNQQLQDGEVELNGEYLGFRVEHFTPWETEDSMAVTRLFFWSSTYNADAELVTSAIVSRAKEVFSPSASDPARRKRAGYLADMLRFAPIDPRTPITGFPDDLVEKGGPAGRGSTLGRRSPGAGTPVSQVAFEATRPFRAGVRRIREMLGFGESSGSNAWVVAASHSASGHALFASDPHLTLNGPTLFWPCHLVAEDPDDPSQDSEVVGVSVPGIANVARGATRHLAFGYTNGLYDLSDVYRETVSPDGKGVMFRGEPVEFETIRETIEIAGRPSYTFDLRVVPHHGPIIPTLTTTLEVQPLQPGAQAFSVRWTGDEPDTSTQAFGGLYGATNVDEALKALEATAIGAGNSLVADASGDVGWTSHLLVPYRDPRAFSFDPSDFTGDIPCLVLDGERGEHEWTGGFLDARYMPKDKRPESGFIASANGDSMGTTVDNDPTNDTLPNGDPFYLGCSFADGLRVGRIYQRLEEGTRAGHKVTVDQMLSLQGDVRYRLAERTVPALLEVLGRARGEADTPGTHPELAEVVADPRFGEADIGDVISTLQDWSEEGEYEAASGVSPDDGSPVRDLREANASKATLIFSAWIVRAMARAFEDEARLLDDRQSIGAAPTIRAFVHLIGSPATELATYDPQSGESALWDDISTTEKVEGRDTILALSLLDALDDARELLGDDRDNWRWGKVHTLRTVPMVPSWPFESPPRGDQRFPRGYPRPGGLGVVDAANFDAMRSSDEQLDFSYNMGASHRMVVEMTPAGPRMWNVIPGGAVGDTQSRHFADELELWRRNETRLVPLEPDEVADAYNPADEHIRFVPR